MLQAAEIEIASEFEIASAVAPRAAANDGARATTSGQPAADRLAAHELAQRLESMRFRADAVLSAVAQSGGQMQEALDVLTSSERGSGRDRNLHAL